MTTLNGKQQRLLDACLDKVPTSAIIEALERRVKPVVPKTTGERWFKPHPSYRGEWPEGFKRYPNGCAKFLRHHSDDEVSLLLEGGLCLRHPHPCAHLNGQCGWVEVTEDEL